MRLAVIAVSNLFKHLGELRGRRQVAGYMLGSQLRRQYGLGRGRKHDVVPLAGYEETVEGQSGYADVDARLTLEALLRDVPSKQREAVELYLEAERTGISVEELARRRGLKGVTVRNNFKAFANKQRS